MLDALYQSLAVFFISLGELSPALLIKNKNLFNIKLSFVLLKSASWFLNISIHYTS